MKQYREMGKGQKKSWTRQVEVYGKIRCWGEFTYKVKKIEQLEKEIIDRWEEM